MDSTSGAVGLVVGKLNPPHLGHIHPNEHGPSRVEPLFVMLYVLFLGMAFVGLSKWMRAESAGVA